MPVVGSMIRVAPPAVMKVFVSVAVAPSTKNVSSSESPSVAVMEPVTVPDPTTGADGGETMTVGSAFCGSMGTTTVMS